MVMTTGIEKKEGRAWVYGIAAIGLAFGAWAGIAFTSLLAQSGWNLAEVLRQYMVATGAIGEKQTLVDYYTHIKGFEYIIAVAFLGLYPAFFKYVNRTKAPIRVK